jgi:hypothetical protein
VIKKKVKETIFCSTRQTFFFNQALAFRFLPFRADPIKFTPSVNPKLSTLFGSECNQGCQMVYFRTKKIPIWVNFGGSCNGTSWYIVWPLSLFYNYLISLMVIWCISWSIFRTFFSRFGMLYQEKSGNPDCNWQKLFLKKNICWSADPIRRSKFLHTTFSKCLFIV